MFTVKNLTLKAVSFLFLFGTGCSKIAVTPGLVSTAEMGTLRGSHFVRAITHFHSPYSFDACDGKGWSPDGTINRSCLHDAKYAICENHINFTFVSDHPEHVSETNFSDLLLNESGDTLIQNSLGENVANQVHCADGFGAVTVPGLEGKLLGLGMQRHIAPDLATRQQYYPDDAAPTKTALEANCGAGVGGNPACGVGVPTPVGAGALVGIPHTESRTIAALLALAPDFIEIYNLHANLDPRIRKTYLGKKPFDKIAKFLNYLLDPYNSLHADYIFMDFFEMSQTYFTTWNTLLANGNHVTGVGGLDSHENIFSQPGSDGQRLDHHRRMTRFMNNIVLTTLDDIDSIKLAIKNGHVFFVIEGMGTPMGLDFHGVSGVTVKEMDNTTTLSIAASVTHTINFHTPTVHTKFPGMDSGDSPEVWAELHYVDNAANESVVATSTGMGTDLVYSALSPGNYRVHVFMKPRHLRQFLFNEDHSDETYTWIITNPIKVVP